MLTDNRLPVSPVGHFFHTTQELSRHCNNPELPMFCHVWMMVGEVGWWWGHLPINTSNSVSDIISVISTIIIIIIIIIRRGGLYVQNYIKSKISYQFKVTIIRINIKLSFPLSLKTDFCSWVKVRSFKLLLYEQKMTNAWYKVKDFTNLR